MDNQQQSEDALRDLHKEYNHVSIQTLKIVYLTLEKNFHQSRTFLEVSLLTKLALLPQKQCC